MRSRLRSLAFGCAALATLGWAGASSAGTCQIPLAVGVAGGDANVLILLDNSGSMNEALVSSEYNPRTTYPGNFSSGSSYDVTSAGSYTPRSFSGSWPSSPSAYLVASDGGRAGQYSGNYLNWVYFTATAEQRAAIPVVTRIQAAKPVVSSVLASVTGCRFAVEVFNGSNGGTILANFGTPVSTMQDLVAGVVGNSYTPLAESMVTAMTYFSTTDAAAPIQSACQKSFVIVVTDGLPTQDTVVPSYISDVGGDGYFLDDVARYMFQSDLRPDLDGKQNVGVFTIGFNVDASLLQRTADYGGGEYFTINDATGLSTALAHAFNTIAARISSGTAVAVVASEDRTKSKMYRARYESQTWRGFVESFALPYRPGDSPRWEAGALLAARSSGSRNIFTSTTGTNTTSFTEVNAGTLSPLLGADIGTATNIIRYIRGDSVSGARYRGGWKLGDIVDSGPVAVGQPSSYNNFAGYWSFRVAEAGRREVVYAGANDGMLHCFDGATGAELWGYVPKSVLPRLNVLMDPSYCHEYFLNMTPVAYDVLTGGTWKTLLIGGEAQGGNGLFALDVTSPSPDTMRVLWDIDLPALKGSWNGPALIRDRRRNAQVFAVGTGYDPTTSQASLIVLNPADGAVLNTFALGLPAAGNKISKGTSIDLNFDGYDDLLFLGDLAGNIWRVDLTTSPWTVTNFFSCGKPIQAPCALTLDALGRVVVIFGTGEFITGTDAASVSQQTIYGIVDDNSGRTVTPLDLADQTTTFHTVASGQRGWYVDLVQGAGERVINRAAVAGGTVFVPSFRPNSGACTGGGQAWLYTLDYKDGSAPDSPNGHPNNVTTGRIKSMGDGIVSDPVIDLLSDKVVMQSSNGVLLSEDSNIGTKRMIVRSWRQKWN